MCQHIALSLQDGQPRGFFFNETSDAAYPDAWCGDCDRLVVDGPWTAELETIAGITLICSGCYLKARGLNHAVDDQP